MDVRRTGADPRQGVTARSPHGGRNHAHPLDGPGLPGGRNVDPGGGNSWACCGGDPALFASFYESQKKFVPWSNANAGYTDVNSYCGGASATRASAIATSPDMPFTAITGQVIPTSTVTQAQAIANIKAVLNQGQAVAFCCFLPGARVERFRAVLGHRRSQHPLGRHRQIQRHVRGRRLRRPPSSWRRCPGTRSPPPSPAPRPRSRWPAAPPWPSKGPAPTVPGPQPSAMPGTSATAPIGRLPIQQIEF